MNAPAAPATEVDLTSLAINEDLRDDSAGQGTHGARGSRNTQKIFDGIISGAPAVDYTEFEAVVMNLDATPSGREFSG
jgi:hypothetical protein